ncbi:MAG: DUF3095 domain-containing protein [Persicimonas sp.]
MTKPDPQIEFFSSLPAFRSFEDVADLRRYEPAPESWLVVITDVKGSTDAIQDGRYKEVNALGACCIVTALNTADGVDIPYVFGGDGATLLIPPTLEEPMGRELAGLARLAERCFGLELRIGLVPVAEVRSSDADVLVARYEASKDVSLAMLSGGGLEVAEKLVKDEALGAPYRVEPTASDDADEPPLEGFQCRWNPIKNRNGKTMAMLVAALDDTPQARHDTYARILEQLNQIGEVDKLHPLAVDTLDLATDLKSFDTEARLRTGKTRGAGYQLHRAKASAQSRVGRRLMERGASLGGFDGSVYPTELIANADFRKFDDALRMVLDVDDTQHRAIEDCLAAERAEGAIAYGTHESDSALMTCLVFDFNGRHVHFVDGSDGGYAMAAKQLKAQLRESNQ